MKYLEFYFFIWCGALINLFLIIRVIFFLIKFRRLLQGDVVNKLICRLLPFPLILIIGWSFPTLSTILSNTKPESDYFWIRIINDICLGSIGSLNTFFYILGEKYTIFVVVLVIIMMKRVFPDQKIY